MISVSKIKGFKLLKKWKFLGFIFFFIKGAYDKRIQNNGLSFKINFFS